MLGGTVSAKEQKRGAHVNRRRRKRRGGWPYFQYTQMFSPPFIVELLLWPLQTIEYGLLYAVASTSAPAAA